MIDPDYFKKKRTELGLDRADGLADIQKTLDQWYPGLVRAKSLNNGLLRLTTPNSTVASELRMRQVELLRSNSAIKRLAITIGVR